MMPDWGPTSVFEIVIGIIGAIVFAFAWIAGALCIGSIAGFLI